MNILLSISGGIAAYKSCNLLRELMNQGHTVRVVMTQAAQQFVTPLTFQVLSQHPVATSLFDPASPDIDHIELARWADLLLVAPATADIIAKTAHGIADDLLSTILLATTSPILFVPAMNCAMWENPALQHNLEILFRRKIAILQPDNGTLACKEVGMGRMPDPPTIIDAIDTLLTPKSLRNSKITIAAGPTREWIDAARFLSNPSSGKMGFSLAKTAARQGADVVLIAGPATEPLPSLPSFFTLPPIPQDPPLPEKYPKDPIYYGSLRIVQVESAEEMRQAVLAESEDSNVVVMAAAVADLTPTFSADADSDSLVNREKKLTKKKLLQHLHFTHTNDILAELGAKYRVGKTPLVVGFAAQTDNVAEKAERKRERKRAHLMIANQIGGEDSAFGSDTTSLHLLRDPYFASDLPLHIQTERLSKRELSEIILESIYEMLDLLAEAALFEQGLEKDYEKAHSTFSKLSQAYGRERRKEEMNKNLTKNKENDR